MTKTPMNTSDAKGGSAACRDGVKDELKDGRQIRFAMILASTFGRVSPCAFAVYATLCLHANYDTRQAWPGHRLISAEAMVSVTTIKKAIKELVEAKLISVKREGSIGREKNVYTLAPAKIKGRKGDPVAKRPGRQKAGDGRQKAETQSPSGCEPEAVERDSKKRETRVSLSKDFEPSIENKKLASESGMDLTVELAKFRAWHSSRGVTSSDWQSALTLWIRRGLEFKNKPQVGGRRTGAIHSSRENLAAYEKDADLVIR